MILFKQGNSIREYPLTAVLPDIVFFERMESYVGKETG